MTGMPDQPVAAEATKYVEQSRAGRDLLRRDLRQGLFRSIVLAVVAMASVTGALLSVGARQSARAAEDAAEAARDAASSAAVITSQVQQESADAACRSKYAAAITETGAKQDAVTKDLLLEVGYWVRGITHTGEPGAENSGFGALEARLAKTQQAADEASRSYSRLLVALAHGDRATVQQMCP